MERYVPADADGVRTLSAPDASWFRGESIDYARRSLWVASVSSITYMETAHSLIGNHLDGKENRRLLTGR